MTRTASSLTSVKKRRKRNVQATSENKEIEKRKKTHDENSIILSHLIIKNFTVFLSCK